MEFLTLLGSNIKKRLSKWVGTIFANSQMGGAAAATWELNMNLLNPVSCTWVIVARAVCMRSATWQPTTLKGKVSPLHVKLHEQIVFLVFCLKFCCHCRGFFFWVVGFCVFFSSRVVLDSLVHHNDMGIPFLEAICTYNCMQAPPPLQSANKS